MAPHRAILRAVECRLMGAVDLVGPVLDIGSGDGHFASIAYDRPIDVGIDLRADELGEAAERGRHVFVSVARADATSLPFRDGAFATVVSNCVIEHIHDNAGVLQRDRPSPAPGRHVRDDAAERALRRVPARIDTAAHTPAPHGCDRVRQLLQPDLVPPPRRATRDLACPIRRGRPRRGRPPVLLLGEGSPGVRPVPLPRHPEPGHPQAVRAMGSASCDDPPVRPMVAPLLRGTAAATDRRLPVLPLRQAGLT